MKKYYFKNVFMGSKIILNSINDKFYKNDGLIFTPMNESYPKTKKWQQLLKWKPAELNTIDFYSVKISSENGIGKWQLYVQGQVEQETRTQNTQNKTEPILFDINKLCGENVKQDITYETTFPENLIDETTGESFQTNTVIEYKWEMVRGINKFVPLRTRWDKTVNPRKHGNFSKVACDIWNNIHNPIEKELLFRFSVNTNNQDFFFERMRKYHNKIKEYLYNKYCKDTDYLLELCSGKGGDMHKWIYNNIKNVCGYDISEKNIKECQRRIQSLRDAKINTNFYKLDLTKDMSHEIIYKNNPEKYDSICCHFGIHYFFESSSTVDNIIKILDTSLKTDGYFIITFLDNTKINNLFEKSGNGKLCYSEKDGEILYLMERNQDEQTCIYGNKLKITLNGNNILGEGSDEWIIDFDNFKTLLESNGYKCVETELFENIYDSKSTDMEFMECERDISFLNRYCVFKKTNIEEMQTNNNTFNDTISTSPSVIYQTVNTLKDMKTEFDFETIDLQQNNISVYKVSSLYNIIDTLNCIEYKYYKNTVQDIIIDGTPDIVTKHIRKLFDDLNIIYNPQFISDPLNFDEYKNGKLNIYFTYYKHTIEKKSDILVDNENSTEIIEYNNWYIIMHNHNLIFDKPIKQTIVETQQIIVETQQTIVETEQLTIVETEQQPIVETEQPTKSKSECKIKIEYEKLKTSGDKITIKILKELLQKLNIKTTGKKEDLQQRLENYFILTN